ncbi:CHAT domain-containing protein [Tolypothrix campylonemoides VB511288]|nr:CHAT domain-containing protein [Tolypothrix campylonemoides VB511288]
MPPDYSGQNLRGRSFKNQDLRGADFSGADIRSADFSGAILRGANFSHAKAGLQKRWAIFLVLVSLLISGLAGFLSAFVGALISYIFDSSSLSNRVSGWAALIAVIIVFIVIIRQGLNSVFAGAYAYAYALAYALAYAIALAYARAGAVAYARAGAGAFAVAGAGAYAFAVALVVAVALAGAYAFAVAYAYAYAYAGARAYAFAVGSAYAGAGAYAYAFAGAYAGARAFAVAFAFAVILLSIYISRQSLKEDPKYVLIRDIAVAVAAFQGTSFRFSDLTDTNFLGATLKSTDFREAILIRTYFYKTKKLDIIRFGTTYLSNQELRQVLATGLGFKKNFNRQNLMKLNFKEFKLVNASFINANLSGVNLQASDLSGVNLKYATLIRINLRKANLSECILEGATLDNAILSETNFSHANLRALNLNDLNLSNANLSNTNLGKVQALGTDFTGATFTGACIEDWNINSATNFTDVICDYIYLREGQKERRPSDINKNFAPGEFTKLFQKVQETVDLIFTDGIDWKAFLLSLEELKKEYGEEKLSVQAIERKSGDVFVIRLEVPSNINKSEIERHVKELYGLKLNLLEETYRTQLQARDREIEIYRKQSADLLEITKSMATRPIQNIIQNTLDVTANAESESMSEAPKKQSNFNLQGAQFGGGLVDAHSVKAHQIGGDITNNKQAKETETNNSPVKTILILASNPKNTSRLRLDEEVREIDAGLQRAKKRELFDLRERWAVRVQEVYQSLLDFKPQIVHFSGHGSGDDGLVLEDETGNVRLVDTVALANLFELFSSTIECVVLNACYSEVQAKAIVKHIPYVIGMNKQIGDKAAIKFATGFYNALGAGESVEFAYKLGCNVIQLEGITENLIPVLKKK